jgi:hypothetical protein
MNSPVLGGFREAEAYTGLSRRSLSRRLSEIEHLRIGARILFTKAGLDAFLACYRVTPRQARRIANVEKVIRAVARQRGARR